MKNFNETIVAKNTVSETITAVNYGNSSFDHIKTYGALAIKLVENEVFSLECTEIHIQADIISMENECLSIWVLIDTEDGLIEDVQMLSSKKEDSVMRRVKEVFETIGWEDVHWR